MYMYDPPPDLAHNEAWNDTVQRVEATLRGFGRTTTDPATKSNNKRRRLVLVVGCGIWDLVFSKEKDIVGWFASQFSELMRGIVEVATATVDSQYISVDFVVRNMFVSLRGGYVRGNCERALYTPEYTDPAAV